jgi:predicted DNA-binding transcriptional regulator AlpA
MQSEEQHASVRVVDQPTALMLLNLSLSTWERMRKRGETPPITQISDRRIGYRISDLEKWLDARRVNTA